MAAALQSGAGHSRRTSALFLNFSSVKNRTRGRLSFLRPTGSTFFPDMISFEPFFPKRMFHFILSAVFISVYVDVNLF